MRRRSSSLRAALGGLWLLVPIAASAQGPMIRSSPLLADALASSGFSGAMFVCAASGIDGCLASDLEAVARRFIPASTFKVLSTLVALETGVVSGPEDMLPWDGLAREREEVNRAMDLRTAFQLSAVPHYQELVRRVGSSRMQGSLEAVGYGNENTTGGEDTFWLTGGLRISPMEQVEFLIRLYMDELPFSARTMAVTREIMRVESEVEASLRAKTGWAVLDGGANVGWWVGWLETEEGAHFFATVLEATDPGTEFGPARMEATRTALAALGLFPARRQGG